MKYDYNNFDETRSAIHCSDCEDQGIYTFGVARKICDCEAGQEVAEFEKLKPRDIIEDYRDLC